MFAVVSLCGNGIVLPSESTSGREGTLVGWNSARLLIAQEADAEHRGLAFAQAGDLKSAEEELRKAVRLAPNSADVLGELGTVLAMEGKLEESTNFLRRALDIAPQNLDLRRYLAANLWQLHRYGEARQSLEILLKAKPGDAQSMLLLGMVSENTGDYPGAVKNLAAVPVLVREKPEAIAALARSYYQTGDAVHGRVWVNELRNHKAGAPGALLGAQIADEAHDYQIAEELLLSLQATVLDQTDLTYRLAAVKFDAGRFAESRGLLTKLVDAGHESGEIDDLLARCYRAERRPDQAIATFRKAVMLEPTKERYYEGLGLMLLEERHLSAALDVTKETVRRFPD